MLIKIFQGAFIGVALVLPGLSAGTVILILGFYRQFLDDISTINVKPYLPMLVGAFGGIIAGVSVISYLLEQFNIAITGFLLGMLLASVPTVLNCRSGFKTPGSAAETAKKYLWPLIFMVAGLITTWFVICEPTRTITIFPQGGYLHFFLGGILASATLLLPGVSGSAMLIIINLYSDVIYAVSSWQWTNLGFLAAGFGIGLLALARLLSALYRRYQRTISFLLAGLIIGSTRALLPDQLNPTFFITAALGAFTVLYFTNRKQK